MQNEHFYDLFGEYAVGTPEQIWSGPLADPARMAYHLRLTSWVLHIYTGAGGMPQYTDAGSAHANAMAKFLNVPELSNPQCNAQQVFEALTKAALQGPACIDEQVPLPAIQPCSMHVNIEWLARTVGLNAVEQDIFELACAVMLFKPLRTAQELWVDLMESDVAHAVSTLIHHPRSEVETALHNKSRLRASGLLQPSVANEDNLYRMLRVTKRLLQRIANCRQDPSAILTDLVLPLQPAKLVLKDFAHMQFDTDLARLWLLGSMGAAQRQECAGHLLISGAPGVGKTEWVRALLARYAPAAHEMVVLDDMGRALSGPERLTHLRLAMVILERQAGGVLLFDEADDVFSPSSATGSDSGDAGREEGFGVSMANHRASLNRLIEESRIPVIWVMNHPEVLDPAVLRRFDTVIAFPAIPQSVKLQMFGERLGHLDAAEQRQWATIEPLTPALIDRLAVVRERAAKMGIDMDIQQSRHWLSRRIPGKPSRHLRSGVVRHAFQGNWNRVFVNASEDLHALSTGIAHAGSARVLLYGPPGTGKTAYVHALAQQIDRPLLEYRASSLLSPYVGQTEQRISAAFETAVQENAVLLLDEVDGLLANRDQAVRTWEVSQVNELLEQLGDYEGVVVLATNRMEALDIAVLRRMDAKIAFRAMNPQQVQQAFAALCESENIDFTALDLQAAGEISDLTPGDFACVARKLKFTSLPTAVSSAAQNLLGLLQHEVNFKLQGRRSIGFHETTMRAQA